MATSAAEKEALRKIKVSGVESVSVGPDAVTTKYRSLEELERIEDGIASETAVSTGVARIRRIAVGIRSGVTC